MKQSGTPMRKPEMFAKHIKSLYPAFTGGFEKPEKLTMEWAWT